MLLTSAYKKCLLMDYELTCGHGCGALDGLDAVRHRLDGHGVVTTRLEVQQGELGLGNEDTAAVAVERLQVVVGHLRADHQAFRT